MAVLKIKNADGTWSYLGGVGLAGEPGEPGEPGYTPVKGTDYWTEEDQAAILQEVLNALPTWTGGSY